MEYIYFPNAFSVILGVYSVQRQFGCWTGNIQQTWHCLEKLIIFLCVKLNVQCNDRWGLYFMFLYNELFLRNI
jgi:hypothetical protein